MPIQETLDEAIQALENERLYDALVEANRPKFLPKSWNEWEAIIFNAVPPASPNPDYQFLRDAYTKFETIQNDYFTNPKKVSDNDIFYRFEKELSTLVTNFRAKYNNLATLVDPVLIEQASATQWFIDDYIRKSPSYIEYIRSQLFNDKKNLIFTDDKINDLFVDREEARAYFKRIKQTVNIINSLKQLVNDLEYGIGTPEQLEIVRLTIEKENYLTPSFQRRFKKLILSAIEKLKATFTPEETVNFKTTIKPLTNLLRRELSAELAAKSKLTLEQFEKLTVSDAQRLFLVTASQGELKTTINMFGLALEIKNDFGINYINDNWQERILNDQQQGMTLNEFSQLEFESKLDFIKQGHCLSYSFLFILYDLLGGSNEVKRMFSNMELLLTLADFSSFSMVPEVALKTKIDSYRAVVNGFYDDYYKDSPLNALIETDRPAHAPKGYYFYYQTS